MAEVYVDAKATSFGYVREDTASTHYSVSANTWYQLETRRTSRTYAKCLLVGFPTVSSSIRHKKLVNSAIYFQGKSDHYIVGDESDYNYYVFSRLKTAFNANTVTWNNKPSLATYEDAYKKLDGGVSATNLTSSNMNAETTYELYSGSRCIQVEPDLSSDYYAKLYINSNRANGTDPIFWRIYYDDAVNITSKVQFNSDSWIGSSNCPTQNSHTFSWNFVRNGANYCLDPTWTQASATFYWRKGTSGSYTAVAASGSTKSVTISGNTFPSGSTIQCYVQATDTEGTTTQTSVVSFTTAQATLTITSAPSGSNIDTRAAIAFAWTLKNDSGDIGQSAAKLFWRISGASTWSQISYTGTTKSISAPANTFPTGKTIQWYVQITDSGGTVFESASGTYPTFTTVSTRVELVTYPSGNDVYTATGLYFSWRYTSSVGEYNQSAAKLYWRSSTSDLYQAITISGNTKYKTVAANTFPTGKTIQWYLEGTDVGGLTTTTSTQSFKTATTKITPQDSPTSGYTDPRYAIVFQWYFASSGGSVPQGSASLYWKVSTDESYTEVQASGSTTKVTIPANTFPVASLIDWYITGADISGATSTSDVYQFSTTATTAYAWPQEPIGIAVDGSKAITLRWLLSNEDGTSPKRVTLEWKKPTDVSWTTIRQADEAFTSWEVEANTFPVGEIEWRVTATNRDNVDGPSGTAAFICQRAPDAPSGLAATAVPRPKIQWQGSGQQAYEISIDGEVVKKAYGIDVSDWTPDFVLADGIHTIRVRIQGAYGYWSDYSETTISVQNSVPAEWEDLALSGKFGTDAVLTCSGAEFTDANWFRDGKRIAVTHGLTSLTDRVVLGAHSYYVELWSEDGNYARSDTVTGTMQSCITRIAPFDGGGDWIDLRLSEKSDSVQDFSYSRSGSLRHVLGTRWPVLELSGFEDLSGKYDCAFLDVKSAAEFEALRGQTVILKSRGGNVVIGALLTLGKQYTDFYISYNFTVQQMDWEDFRDVSADD